MVMISSILVGLAVGGFFWILLDIIMRKRDRLIINRFEEDRIQQLRQGNWVYRIFEPLVDEISTKMVNRKSKSFLRLADGIHLAEPLPWKPEEYVATRRVEGIFYGFGIFGLLYILTSLTTSLLGALFFVWFYDVMSARAANARVVLERLTIKRRFAAAMDLMALMLEVGGDFYSGLEALINENAKHKLGKELARCKKDIDMGRTKRDALKSLSDRINDPDVGEIIFAIVEGEELGTPLSEILSAQSARMRSKRSQWAEKSAEESKVALVFPAMIIMVACLLIVAAPFVLSAIYSESPM